MKDSSGGLSNASQIGGEPPRISPLFTQLKQWLQDHAEVICAATINRAPNLIPDDEDVAEFLAMLIDCIGRARDTQLSTVQFWGLTSVGHDARAANDWLTILWVVKEELSQKLEEQFPAEDVLRAWWHLDTILTYALIEATQLGSDMDRATLLDHMVELRQQMERLEKTRANFVAVAAHELKTPLTILEGYANMLRVETEPESSLRLYVDGMENGTRRLNEVISDMIDVSLIDTNAFELNYSQFYLEKIILMTADSLDHYFAERRVELVIMPLGVEQRIYGDPERLFKAFAKILINALKFTPDGGRVIVNSVFTRQEEATEAIAGYVDVQVADTGIGINAEDLERIFDKFTTTIDASLHSSGKTKFKGGGPGLGLPIAKGIVEAHGGRIWAESPGHDETACPGSTFHIELPILLSMPDFAVDIWQQDA